MLTRRIPTMLLVLVSAACTGNQPPPTEPANPPVDQSAMVRSEFETLEGDVTASLAAMSTEPTRGPDVREESLTRGGEGEGSTIGEEFVAGAAALANPGGGDPCAGESADMAAYDRCHYENDVAPCRDDYMGDRDPCFGLEGAAEDDCVKDAKESFCNCLENSGHPGGGC